MKNKCVFILAIALFISCSSNKVTSVANDKLTSYSFEEVEDLMISKPKNIAVFMHAKWCKYCKNMEQTTFKNTKVADLLQEDFYFISFDGEQKESVVFNERQFDYKPSGRHYGTHELAMELGTIDGELAYPVFVVLNPEREIIFQHASYLNAESLTTVLRKIPK